MSSIIEVNNLTVRYGRRAAVDEVTLAVPQGAVYALLGRNGAGKSSLVRCLLGQQKAASGTIRLFGEDVWQRRTTLMERVGVVSEDSDAPPEMSVAALSRFCSRLYSRWQQSSVDTRLARFGISQKSRFGTLSKGQKKQVSLALALAMSPDLIVLDDPTLGLDVVARKSFFEEVIGELADRGITVLLTTHDLAGVESIADRVGIMKDGRLALDEETETLKARFRRVRFAGVSPSTAEREESPSQRWGSLTSLGMTPRVVRQWGSGAEAVVTDYDDVAFERFRATTSGAEVVPMSLEEIFIAVAGETGAQS